MTFLEATANVLRSDFATMPVAACLAFGMPHGAQGDRGDFLSQRRGPHRCPSRCSPNPLARVESAVRTIAQRRRGTE